MGREGRVVRIYPGGGGDMGIAEFAGDIPPAHVSTMLKFPAWEHVPSADVLPPCRCVAVGDGVVLSDGCPQHGGGAAVVMAVDQPIAEAFAMLGREFAAGCAAGIETVTFRAKSHRFLNRPKEPALCP